MASPFSFEISYVKNNLESNFGNILLVSVTADVGSAAGDNVAGEIVSVTAVTKIDDRDRIFHFVCKRPPPNSLSQMFLKMTRSFYKESEMYRTVLPSLKKKFVPDNSIDKSFDFLPTPKYYDSAIDEENFSSCIILLEDVRGDGFKMANKNDGLTFDECKIVIRDIARYHGVWYAVKTIEKKPFGETFPSVQNFMQENTQMLYGMCSSYFKATLDYLVECNESQLGEKFSRYLGKEFECLSPVLMTPETDPFTVVCHSDFWMNNILFKYDSNNHPIEASYIDFQHYKPISCMYDLVYFFFTSTTSPLRKNHLEDLLKLHQEEFTKTISNFSVDVPQVFEYENYKKKFLESLPCAAIYMCFALSFQLGDPKILDQYLKCQPGDEQQIILINKLLRSGNVKNRLIDVLKDISNLLTL